MTDKCREMQSNCREAFIQYSDSPYDDYAYTHFEAGWKAAQNAEKSSNTKELERQWLPILRYLQDNPGIIKAKVGDSISEKLLDYLKNADKAEVLSDREFESLCRIIFDLLKRLRTNARSFVEHSPPSKVKANKNWQIIDDASNRLNDIYIKRAALSVIPTHTELLKQCEEAFKYYAEFNSDSGLYIGNGIAKQALEEIKKAKV